MIASGPSAGGSRAWPLVQMLLSRVIVAVVFIPLLLLAVVLRGPLLLVVVVAATTVACLELSWMFHQRRLRVPAPGTVLVGLAYLWPTYLQQPLWPWLLGAVVGAAVLAGLGAGSPVERLRNLALAVAGGTYVGFLARYALLVGALPDGAAWGVLVLLATWAADTGGYFVGRWVGRRPLAPAISPSKTWEGVGGALVLTVATVAMMAPVLQLPLSHVPLLGLALALGAVGGDLGESWLKRQTGVKDSSKLLAGHGGFLDRMDSVLVVFPMVYAYAVWFAV